MLDTLGKEVNTRKSLGLLQQVLRKCIRYLYKYESLSFRRPDLSNQANSYLRTADNKIVGCRYC